MATIKFRFNVSFVLASAPHSSTTKSVEIKTKEGGLKRVNWLGFVCEHGLPHIGAGVWGKMVAWEVSDADWLANRWRKLDDDEYVLCWLVSMDRQGFGAYAIVGADGWPVVMREKPIDQRRYKPCADTRGVILQMPSSGTSST